MSGKSERGFGRTLAVARRFTGALAEHRWKLIGIATLSLASAGLNVLKPWPMQWVFDGAISPRHAPEAPFAQVVWTAVATAIALAVALAVVDYVREISLATVSHLVSRGLRFRVFAHLTKLSPTFHAAHKPGDLLVRLMGDVPLVTTMLVDSAVDLATRGLLIAGVGAVMLAIDPVLTLLLAATLPALALLNRWLGGQLSHAARKQRNKEAALADYLHEAIGAVTVVQALGSDGRLVDRFSEDNRRSTKAGLRAARLSARLGAAVESVLGVAVALALAVGSFRVAAGALSPGELLVFLSYLRSLLKPVRSASKHSERIAKGTAGGERLLAVLDERAAVTSVPGAAAAPVSPAELRFDEVCHTYGDGTPALNGFSATFRRGELAALVGRSGAGKSTVAALALRLFDPSSGQVRFDGRDIADFDLTSLREVTGLAMQRSVLFGETIRENLLLTRADATDEELWEALEQGGAAEFVSALPLGLDEPLGAAGAGLSGGEQSRLSLARTLLKRPAVLFVDEPFAGLDRQSAATVHRTLRRLAGERIVVVITHQLEVHADYDQIVLLERGRAVAAGRHGSLLQTVPLYGAVVGERAAPPAGDEATLEEAIA